MLRPLSLLRLLSLPIMIGLTAACAQPVPPAPTVANTTASVSSPSDRSDQDLCYELNDAPGHDDRRSLAACDRLIATGDYQGYTLAKIYLNRAIELRQIGRVEDSLASIDQAIRIRPEYDFAYRQKSYSLIDLYRYEDAVDAAQKSVDLDPEDSANVGQLGRALRKAERYPEAAKSMELALLLEPNDPWTLRELGWLAYDQEDYEAALSRFRVALRADTENAWTHYAIGYVLIDLDDPSGALDAFNRADSLKPGNSNFLNLIGYTRLIEGSSVFDVPKAIQSLKRAQQADPTHLYVRYHLATAYAYSGRGTEALAELKKAVDGRLYRDKIQRVVRILWDQDLSTDAKAASALLEREGA